MPGKTLPTFTQAEIARHNSQKSCYVTIGSHVYDVTGFLEDHPGGDQLILDYAGKDVGEAMKDPLSNVHSEGAYDMLHDLLVGFVATEKNSKGVATSKQPTTIIYPPPEQEELKPLKEKDVVNDLVGKGTPKQSPLYVEEVVAKIDPQPPTPQERKAFIDINKPMLMQIWNGGFTKEHYLDEVHKPRHYMKPKKDGTGKEAGSAPLFGNFLEPLSMTPWWLIPLLWYPCVVWTFSLANAGLSSPIETTAYFFLGLFLWTLVEYGMHRGLFHVDKYLPDNRVGLTAHFLLHGIHHFLPNDRYRLVMPPVLLIFLATPFYQLAHTVFYWDWYVATAVFCGGFFGYTGYDITHYFLHHKNLPSFYHELKTYHRVHHYNDHENGFGVTSRFWDKVFGTELGLPPKAAKAA